MKFDDIVKELNSYPFPEIPSESEEQEIISKFYCVEKYINGIDDES